MKIALASDHAGIELKKGIVSYLAENGIDHQDVLHGLSHT